MLVSEFPAERFPNSSDLLLSVSLLLVLVESQSKIVCLGAEDMTIDHRSNSFCCLSVYTHLRRGNIVYTGVDQMPTKYKINLYMRSALIFVLNSSQTKTAPVTQ